MKVNDILKVISTEHDRLASKPTFVTFLWYRGQADPGGEWETFRFARGGSPDKFHNLIKWAGYKKVEGPFTTKKEATK